MIPVYVPTLPSPKKTQKYLDIAHKAKRYSNYGPLLQMFEERIAELLNVERACLTTLSNATLAMEGAIKSIHGNVAYWQLPSWGFAAAGHALSNSGKRARFIDVTSDWRVDTSQYSEGAGFIDVTTFGDSASWDRYTNFPQILILDAAASFDALTKEKNLFPNDGVGIILSLHATKLLPAGEGGMFMSSDKEWVSRVKRWANFGFSEGSRDSYGQATNAKFSEFEAAVALASLDDWPRISEQYYELNDWALETSLLADFMVQPAIQKGFASPYWIVKSTPERIRTLIKTCKIKDIETRLWWSRGMHKMQSFMEWEFGNLTNTEELSETTVGLPFHLYLGKKDKKLIRSLLSSV